MCNLCLIAVAQLQSVNITVWCSIAAVLLLIFLRCLCSVNQEARADVNKQSQHFLLHHNCNISSKHSKMSQLTETFIFLFLFFKFLLWLELIFHDGPMVQTRSSRRKSHCVPIDRLQDVDIYFHSGSCSSTGTAKEGQTAVIHS